MKPTLGEIVEYNRPGSLDKVHKPAPSPAIITEVCEDGITCKMTVFNPNGLYLGDPIPYCVEPLAGHWCWPERMRSKIG